MCSAVEFPPNQKSAQIRERAYFIENSAGFLFAFRLSPGFFAIVSLLLRSSWNQLDFHENSASASKVSTKF